MVLMSETLWGMPRLYGTENKNPPRGGFLGSAPAQRASGHRGLSRV
jgi:hypothetical protein